MDKPKILLVEDEENFGSVLSQFLRLNDFEITWAKHGKEAWSIIHTQGQFDCCILDVMMPEMDGFTLGKEIRKIDPDVPFIYLTARGMKEDMVEGYKSGADDYLTKPFDSEVLVLKLRALLKRNNTSNEEVLFSIGSFMFNSEERQLEREGEVSQLSPKECGILLHLVRAKGRVVPRELIMADLWDEDNYFNRRSMDVYMSKLRKHLRNDPRVGLVSLHAGGYKLVVADQG